MKEAKLRLFDEMKANKICWITSENKILETLLGPIHGIMDLNL